MNLNIPPTPTNDTPPDAVRLALLNRDEACRKAMAERRAAKAAGCPVQAKKRAKRRNSHSRKSGQMDAHVYLSAFEVEK